MTSFCLVLDFTFLFLWDPQEQLIIIHHVYVRTTICTHIHVYIHTCVYMIYTGMCTYTIESQHELYVVCSVMPLSHELACGALLGIYFCHWAVYECFSLLLLFPWRPSLIRVEIRFSLLLLLCLLWLFQVFLVLISFLKKPRIVCILAMHLPLTSCWAYTVVSCGYRDQLRYV